jgi:imidazolonepropionase-like amidohydrolase
VARPQNPPAAVLVRDVAVLDVESGVRVAGRDVLLRDGRIAAIEPTGRVAASEAAVVEGAGATLLPGLIDMHAHLNSGNRPAWEFGFPDPEANLRNNLYAGVTSLLDPGDASADAFERRSRLASGELLGPRVYTAGTLLTCPDGHPVAMVREFAPGWISWYIESQIANQVANAEEAGLAVDALAESGVDVVKVAIDRIPLDAPRMPRETLEAIIARASDHDLRVVAHIGSTQDAIDAAEAGVALWVHGVYKDRIPEALVARLAAYGIPMVATIEVFERHARGRSGPILPNRLERESVPADVLDSYYPVPADLDLGGFGPWLEAVERNRGLTAENVMRLRRAGVTILAGSDTQSGVFAGAGLHRELGQLVEAGLTPSEAIRAATLDPARFLAARGPAAGGRRPDPRRLRPPGPAGGVPGRRGARAARHSHGRFLSPCGFAYAARGGRQGDEMSILDRYQAYADAFEETFLDDDWSRIAPFFSEDAVYEGEPEARGRDALLAKLKNGVDAFDRRMDSRTPAFDTPSVSGDTLSMKWRVTYTKAGAPDLEISGVETAVFRGDQIALLRDDFDPEAQKTMGEWMAAHGAKLQA